LAFTPTHASWLNQIEIWFGILTRKVVRRGIFKSREELVERLMSFIQAYSREARPFEWTYTGNPLAA
jgi:putative transposase